MLEVGAEVRVKPEGRIGTVSLKEDGDILVVFRDGNLPRSATFKEPTDELDVVAAALQVSAKFLGGDKEDCHFSLGRSSTVGDARGQVEDLFEISWDSILLKDSSGVSLFDDSRGIGELAQDGTVVLTVFRLPETLEVSVLIGEEFGCYDKCTVNVRITSDLDNIKRMCLSDIGLHAPASSICMSSLHGHPFRDDEKLVTMLGPSPEFAVPELRLGRGTDTVELSVALGFGGDAFKFFSGKDWKVIDIKRHIESTKNIQASAFALLYEGRTLIEDEVFLATAPEPVQLQLIRTGAEVYFCGHCELSDINCGKFSVQPPYGAAEVQIHRKCLIQYFNENLTSGLVDEEALDKCPEEMQGDPENNDGFCKGIVDPPYGGEPLAKFRDTLVQIYGGSEAANSGFLTVYSWTEDCENPEKNFSPDFFQAGLEGWGVYVFTVGNKETGQVAVFAASSTDY